MNRKGEGLVTVFISIVIVALLVGTLAIPVVKQSTDAVRATDTYTKTLTSANETYNLTNVPVVDASLSIDGLTEDANYTVDYDLGSVTFLAEASTNASAYTISYEYTLEQYLSDSGERILFAMIALALIIGLIVFILSQFDLA